MNGRAIARGRAPRFLVRLAAALLAGAGLSLVLLGASHVFLRWPSVQGRIRSRLEAELRARLGEVSLGAKMSTAWPLRLTFGPLDIPAPEPEAKPFAHVDQVAVTPSLLALLRGRLEPASVRISGAHLSLASAPHLPEAPAKGSREIGEKQRDRRLPRIEFADLFVALPLGKRQLSVGPLAGAVQRPSGERPWSLEIRGPAGGRLSASLERAADRLRARATVAELEASELPSALREGAVALARGRLSGEVEAVVSADFSHALLRFNFGASGLVFEGERLALEPLGPISAKARGDLVWGKGGRRLQLEDGQVELFGALPVALAAEVNFGRGLPFSVSAHTEAVDFGKLVDSLPTALAPGADAPRPPGAFSARLGLSGQLGRPESWVVDAALNLAGLREASRRAKVVGLRAPFAFHPEVSAGKPPAIQVGPGGRDFVPFAELPEHVVRAVTTSEDGGFFSHQGFEFDELKNAFAEGARAGKVVRGGSTITQQLAKNLYLSREKTLARKGREAFLTVALEATVPKQRLLEIYLNIVEWGPGLWGIGPAARHWFGKDARSLTPKEAAFLASILPNPVLYHAMFARREVSEAWEQRVDTVLRRLGETGVLTDEEVTRAIATPIVFAGGCGTAGRTPRAPRHRSRCASRAGLSP